jgi:phosphonate transport system substrate-binding protein
MMVVGMRMITTALCVAFLMSANSNADAETACQSGTLDSRYCDRDQDLVADLPIDQSDWLDPAALIFSYTPVEDPAVYEKVWDGFIDHLEMITGKRVIFFPVQSYAAQYEAMRSGRLHIAGINTGGTPIAVNCAGFVPFAMMAAEDGSYGYEMEIIVPAASNLQVPTDIKGKTLAFTTPTSNSGFKAPSAILKAEFGLIADQDFKTSFSGKHDNSILGVANGDYEAAAVANSVLARMIDRDAVDHTALRSIYKSQTFPTTAYGHAYNLHPLIAAQVRQAFFTFPWAESGLSDEFAEDDGFVSIGYKTDWQIIRTVDSANDVSYDCR